MVKTIAKNIVIVLLIMWCLFGTISPFVDPFALIDGFGFIVTFLIVVLPFSIALFLLSLSIIRSNAISQEILGFTGVSVSIIVFAINILTSMWVISR